MNEQKIYHVIGLMSGTSLDGLDIALCRFDFSNTKPKYEIIHTQTVAYSLQWQSTLRTLENMTAFDFVKADRDIGDYFGECVKKFIATFGINQVDFVASHGHTIFHQPQHKITSQIGCGANIAAKCGVSVVCDFRTLDVALGGQGAPLVPIGDKLLFAEYDFCLNLGGIANISYQNNNQTIAFDICVANMTLNSIANKIGLEYDKDGLVAQKGAVNSEILSQLNQLNFYKLNPPKSLGKEWVLGEFYPLFANKSIKNEDILATLCHHIAYQITRIINKISTDRNTKLLVTGGGAHNNFLINCIKSSLIQSCELIIPDEKTVNYKEALIFALLGTLRWRNQTNALCSVTGALKNSVGGCIYIHN